MSTDNKEEVQETSPQEEKPQDTLEDLIDDDEAPTLTKNDSKVSNGNANDEEVDLNNPKVGEEGDADAEIQQIEESDKRSIFVKNVDYQSTKEQITDHFKVNF